MKRSRQYNNKGTCPSLQALYTSFVYIRSPVTKLGDRHTFCLSSSSHISLPPPPSCSKHYFETLVLFCMALFMDEDPVKDAGLFPTFNAIIWCHSVSFPFSCFLVNGFSSISYSVIVINCSSVWETIPCCFLNLLGFNCNHKLEALGCLCSGAEAPGFMGQALVVGTEGRQAGQPRSLDFQVQIRVLWPNTTWISLSKPYTVLNLSLQTYKPELERQDLCV